MDSGRPDDNTSEAPMPPRTSLRSVSSTGSSVAETGVTSDERLVAGLLEGDRQMAGILYDHLRAPIDGTLRRILHQRGPDFEDLVQITFEHIIRNLGQGKFEGRSSLKTWACAIASHVALDALRRKQRERLRTDDGVAHDSLPSASRTDAKVESLGELHRVQGILSEMKPKLAEALILHDVLGHKLREIAGMSGLTESAVQSRVHRARIELKRRAERPILGRGT